MNVNDLFNRQSASSGFKQVTGTAVQSEDPGTYFAVQFVTECTTSAFRFYNSETQDITTFPAGLVVYGDVASIICSANNVYILYKK